MFGNEHIAGSRLLPCRSSWSRGSGRGGRSGKRRGALRPRGYRPGAKPDGLSTGAPILGSTRTQPGFTVERQGSSACPRPAAWAVAGDLLTPSPRLPSGP